MTDSSSSHAGLDDLPPSSLTASHLVTDHDVAARIARGHNLLRRVVVDRAGVRRFVTDLTEWTRHNRELLAKRFTDPAVAGAYAGIAEPLVVPAEGTDTRAQIDVLHRQLRHQLEWLEHLRLTIPEREQPPTPRGEPRLTRAGRTRRIPAVLATTASPVAASVVGAVARATGMLPVVVEDHPGEGRSLVRAAERTLPSDAVAVVVLEPHDEGDPARPSIASLLALGYAAGAFGAEDVIAVCAPGLARADELADFATVFMQPGDAWRHLLSALLSQAGFSPTALVRSLQRS